ncbi:hypothetical protein [Streptomyces sp. SID8352]|uniref:hypothetical protein n=1 Tax=Streptomyces sp. SID8352 TaxID=2690338 RepID=UPI00139CCEFF|nr:hypothetical protein [Streptomyces sp. SID8352]MYU25643.1 hypothetical protein [Streptomyces sp. SID8352]
MSVGLISTIAAVFYGGTVSVIALTATFARRRSLRDEARSTLAVLVPGGSSGPSGQEDGPGVIGPNDG